MSFLSPGGLRAEVVEGIDLESGVTLSGERVTVGSAPSDTLVLGEPDVAPGQLTFQRNGKGWEYFVSDRGTTEVARGSPRAGPLRAGMSFRLGSSARIEIRKAEAPVAVPEDGGAGQKKEVPLAIAIPALLAMVGVFAFGLWFARAGGGDEGSALLTEGWFDRSVELGPFLGDCLLSAEGMAPAAVPADAPDAAFQAWLAAGGEAGMQADAEARLTGEVRGVIARAHLLAAEGQAAAASEELRRMEYVIPLGERPCPILTATRRDLALLALRGN